MHFRELFRGGSIAIAFRLLSALASYVFLYFIARRYGADGVGIFSTGWTILMISAVFGKMGFDSSIVRFISESAALHSYSRLRKIYRKSLKITLISTIVVAVVLFGFSEFFTSKFFDTISSPRMMYLIAIAVIPYSLMSFNAESLKGLKRITAYSLHQNISIYFGGMLILMILSCFTPSVIAIWWSLLIIFILLMITSGFTFRYFLKFLPNRDSHYSRPVPGIKQIIRITLPMMLSNSLFLLMNWTDVLMLAYIQGDDQVGIYNTALKIAALNSLVLIAVNSIAMPKYSELYNQNKLRFKQLAKAVSFISFFVSLPVFLMIVIFPTTILGLFGEAFTEGSQAMIVLSVGQLFATISGSTINLLNMTGKEKSTMYILITSVIVNFFLNFILIPLFGLNGAAYATASSTVLWNLLAVVLIYKYHGFLTYPIINPAKIKYYFNIFFS